VDVELLFGDLILAGSVGLLSLKMERSYLQAFVGNNDRVGDIEKRLKGVQNQYISFSLQY
jgi:hypothetical protein